MIQKILLVAIIILLLTVGYIGIRAEHLAKKIDKLENKINLQTNNYGRGKEGLKQELKDPRIDSLLGLARIKPKNVQSITHVHYTTNNTFKSDSLIRISDTSVCIDYNYKGFKLSGCNGLYNDERTFNATGILHMKPTKHLLGIIHYRKKPVLQSWTEYGDTLDISLVERK